MMIAKTFLITLTFMAVSICIACAQITGGKEVPDTPNVLHDFEGGTPAYADDVNDNFAVLRDAVNNSRIEGVANAGGNIDLVAGSGISISGNDTSNTITISTSNVNANTLDGYNSTDFGIRNGSVQTNLNADLLDGNHASSFASSTHNHSGVYMPSAGTIGTTTRYYSIPSCDFMPANKTIDYQHTNGFVRGDTPGQSVTFLAPIHLPHGARMTQFIAVVKDSDGTQNISVTLIGQFTTGGAYLIGSTLTSSGSPGQTRINSTTFNETIDNLDKAYLVQADWTTPGTDTNIELFHVQIIYTVTSVLP